MNNPLSKKETIMISVVTVITSPIWLPYVGIKKLIKKIKGR